ncbi:MAG: hypothetical protein EPO59_21685 [Bosea sp. (in: a-proteobacteria)]|nr:MAG: hypothetical protein EPO59_21685 [Bosea sp. (in: a-proteobacteria)]
MPASCRGAVGLKPSWGAVPHGAKTDACPRERLSGHGWRVSPKQCAVPAQ